MHGCNYSAQEAEAGGLSQVCGQLVYIDQPKLYSENFFENKKKLHNSWLSG